MAEEVKVLLNGLIDEEDDLGSILFGTYDDFQDRVKLLDDAKKQEYTDELQKMGLIEYDDDEEQD